MTALSRAQDPNPTAPPKSAHGWRPSWTVALAAPAAVLPAAVASRPLFPPGMALAGALVAVAACGVAAVTDFRCGKIFNWCTYSAAAWAVILATVGAAAPDAATALGTLTPAECLVGLFGCLGVMFVLQDLAGGGMGDVKLGAAIGGLVGLSQGLTTILLSFALAGVAVLAWCVVLHGPWATAVAFLKAYARWFLPESVRPALRPDEVALLHRKIRLGPFFALGAALTLLSPQTVIVF